jgi:hypothetical protein
MAGVFQWTVNAQNINSVPYGSLLMKSKPVVLLMTATITPPDNCPDLARNDPALRMRDYITALSFYLNVPPQYCDRIIFAENSDTNLEPLKSILKSNHYNKQVEFISFPQGNNYPPKYGKGYGEMLLIDYAMDNSRILSKDDFIWKATGRLILNNFNAMIRTSPVDYDVYCDLHNGYKLLRLEHFFDPRFYAFTRKGYDAYFRPHTDKLRGAHIEHYFHDVLSRRLNDGKIIPRFKKVPMIRGIVASSNDNYFTTQKIIQRHVQQFFRTLTPWFWL